MPSADGGGAGGRGGKVTATVSVTPGHTLYTNVMNIPAWGNGPARGATGGNGGEGSFVTTNAECGPRNPTGVLVVAGGGGGGGGGDTFGPGGTGGDAGAAGNPGGNNEARAGAGGGGGTSSAGGGGGAGGTGATSGDAGSLFHGGVSGSAGGSCSCVEGGTGGSGYFGGGGGGGSGGNGAGGGGGGANFVVAGATNVSMGATTDWPPYITIDPAVYSTATTVSSSQTPSPTGHDVTYTATVASTPAGGSVDFSATQGATTIDMGSAPVNTTNGRASLPYVLSPGFWSVSAHYGGDGRDLASTSSPITQQIGSAPAPDFISPGSWTVSDSQPDVTVTAGATGDPTPSVQWQISGDGGATWTDLPHATSSTINLTKNIPGSGEFQVLNGGAYRAVFTNIIGAAASDPAVINVQNAASVLVSPTDVVSAVNGSVQFFTAATGNPLPDAQSQVSADGGSTWSVIDGTNTQTTGGGNPQTIATLTVGPVSDAQNGYEYRTVFTNTVEGVTNSVFTAPATLAVVNACIQADPTSTDFSLCHGVDLTGPSLATIVLNFGDYSNANLTGQTVRALNFSEPQQRQAPECCRRARRAPVLVAPGS